MPCNFECFLYAGSILCPKPHGEEPSRDLTEGDLFGLSGWGHPLEICQEFALVASGWEGAVCDGDPTNQTVGIPLVWVAFGVSGEASGALRGAAFRHLHLVH